MSELIRLGLIEDQFLFREGLKAILKTWSNLEVVVEASTGYEAIDLLTNAPLLPNVVLIDLTLPNNKEGKTFSGLEVTKIIRASFPDIKVIILSVHDDPYLIADLILNGAHGYLVKDSDPQDVYEAIVAVHTKGSFINERSLAAIQKKNSLPERTKSQTPINSQLSKREIEVLQLICRQHTTEEIAEKLFISIKTVNGHRNNLLQKTNCRNAAGLVSYAIKNKLTELI